MKNQIQSVRIETSMDECSDTSWLGDYSNSPKNEFSIDRQERGDMGRWQYRYFNPGSVESFNPNASWIPVDVIDKREYWSEAMKANADKDYKRMESLNAGDWCFVWIVAKAVVVSANGVTQTLRSGGLGGIESDSDKDHIKSIEQDELTGLRAELEAFGFGKRAIDYAFKSVTHCAK